MRNRFGIVICGAQRGGKSDLTNRIANGYMSGGGSVLVYNLGKESKDFLSCELCELLTEREHYKYIKKTDGEKAAKEWRKDADFMYMKTKSKGVFHISEFNKLYYKSGVRVKKLPKDFEDAFFYAFYEYVSNTMLVFDDCNSIFPNKLRAWQDQLLGRMNHTGSNHKYENYKDQGSELVFIYHNLNQIPKAVLDYYNDDYHFISFKYSEEPHLKNIGNSELQKSVKFSFNALKKLPKYSYTVFNEGETIVNKSIGAYKYTSETFKIE